MPEIQAKTTDDDRFSNDAAAAAAPAVPPHSPTARARGVDESRTYTRREFAIMTGVATAAVATGAGTVAAQSDTLNYASDFVANPFISATLTKDRHEPGWDPLDYYDDDAARDRLPAVLDERDPTDNTETTANLFTFNAANVDADGYRAFPRDEFGTDADGNEDPDQPVSVIDAANWDDADTNAAVTDVDGDVDAIEVAATPGDGVTATVGFAPADATAPYVEDDIERRYLQVGANVTALDAAATAAIRVSDADGDYVEVSIDPNGDAAADDVLATETGTGFVTQVRLGDATIGGTGDGTLNEIESVEVIANDAGVTVELFGFDVENKSRWEFAETVVAENTDDESTETVRNPSGDISASQLLGLADSSMIYDLTIPTMFTAEKADAGEWSTSDADRYPGYDVELEQFERLALTTGFDLSYANVTLELEQRLPGDRYHALELASDTEDVDDTEDMTFSDKSGTLASEGDWIELESIITPGTEYTLRSAIIQTESEFDSATVAAGGAGGGARSTASGGWFSGARGLLIGGFVAVVAWFGGLKDRMPW